MTLTANKFTPEVLLSAPRRSAAVPNSTGTRAVYSVSTYSFNDHKKSSQIRVLDIESGDSVSLVDDVNASEPVWLAGDEVLHLQSGDKGTTTLVVRRLTTSYEAGTIKAPISSAKVKQLPDGNFVFACAAAATPDGQLFNPETAKKPRSTARVYTSLFVRHWDTWNTETSPSIFYGLLEHKDGKYKLRDDALTNALAGTGLSSPVGPFGGTGDFDLSTEGLVFVAKDPELDPAIYTKTNLYFIPLKSWTESALSAPRKIKTHGLEGYSNNPVFSHCGRKVAFTRMRSNQYESDKTRLLLVPDISKPDQTEEFYATDDGNGGWDARPESIVWSHDDSKLYVTAEDRARSRIFQLASDPSKATSLPTPIETPEGSVGAFFLLPKHKSSSSSSSSSPSSSASSSPANSDDNDRLFVTSSSLIDNSCYSIAYPASPSFSLNTTTTPNHSPSPSPSPTILSSASKQGKTFGLSRSQIDSITFPGAGGAYDVHALVVRPSTFDRSSPNHKKKYPLALLIHGGPQGAWLDSWSTRWNPAVFAEQGYVVVCPNPTGSTGYGMALQNGIRGEWGGRPYNDLEKCVEWVGENMPEVDVDRAVALGASFGGFMINWIQGQPLGRKFKALVCHDGVFSTLNQWSTEELFFPIHDFEGTMWDNRESYEKWDPAKLLDQWATPQLIIHSELDYRLPVTEGLAAFNVLQARKVPSKLLVFPDENHWVLKHENSLVWHREVISFINKYSGIEDEQNLSGEAERLKLE